MIGARRRPAWRNSHFEWTGFWSTIFRRLTVTVARVLARGRALLPSRAERTVCHLERQWTMLTRSMAFRSHLGRTILILSRSLASVTELVECITDTPGDRRVPNLFRRTIP